MTTSRLLVLCAAAACLSGCSSGENPSFEEASHQFYEAYCGKLLQCHIQNRNNDTKLGTDDFLLSYTGGVSDCVEENYGEFSSLSKLESKCTQEQWDQCTKDMATTGCILPPPGGGPPFVGPVIPASCKEC